MLSRYEHGGIVWLDLENPTAREVKDLAQQIGLEPLIAEELLLPSARPRIEVYEHYMYLILHFPALRHSHTTVEQEVDFVIGKNFLITTHYDTIDPLHKFSKIFEVNSVLDKSNMGEHAGFLFYYMLKKLYKAVDHELEFIRRDLSSVEEHIFSGEEVSMVAAISESGRDLLNVRQTIEPHRDVLHQFEIEGPKFFGHDFLSYARSLSNEYYRVHNHVERQAETLRELRETNNSLLTTKQNETIRILTIMAFLTFPPSLIAALFETTAKNVPIVGSPYDFWIILALMTGTALVLFSYFKYKKWL